MQKKSFSRLVLGVVLAAGICGPALAESETVNPGCMAAACGPALAESEVAEAECLPAEEQPADIMVFPLSFGAVVPIGTLQDDGSYKTDREVGIQLIGPPHAPTFYGLGLDTALFLFEAEELYGVYVGSCARIKDVYGLQLTLANMNGELIPETFSATGNCYGLQAALGNISGNAYVQLGALGNFAATVSGGQLGGIANKTDTLYGMQLGAINGVLAAEDSSGLQVGVINAVDGAEDPISLIQFGVLNGATVPSCLQAGVINAADAGMEFQFGIWNESSGAGWQVGLLNFSEHAWVPFFPFLLYTSPAEVCPAGACQCDCEAQ